LVVSGIVHTVRKFLFPLRNVFLDKVNRKILVEYRNEIIVIPISTVEKIEEQSRLGKILNVKLNLTTKFGNEFVFIPKDNKVIREITELKN
jgi:sporulation protein YlmC with PRC-barrel domain